MIWRQGIGLPLASLAISCARIPKQDDGPPADHREQGKLLATEPIRVMTYDIRHAGDSSLAAIAETILIGDLWETGVSSTVDAAWQSDHRPLMAGLRPKPAFTSTACAPSAAAGDPLACARR